jgi:hypothetical protein
MIMENADIKEVFNKDKQRRENEAAYLKTLARLCEHYGMIPLPTSLSEKEQANDQESSTPKW